MALKLTPELLKTTYNGLLETEPFRRWSLPRDGLCFVVVDKILSDYDSFAEFTEPNTFRFSRIKVKNLPELVRTMAHEMIHMKQYLAGETDHHGASFHRYAKRVCKIHKFNLKEF